MTTWIEPPPPQKGMGCFGKGCIILVAFCVLLGAAFVGGTFYAIHYLRGEYFPKTGVQLPADAATDQEQQEILARWHSFETHARAHEPAHIELTAQEINALILAEPKLRGKAHVAIADNVLRLQLSVGLDNVRWLRGHYVNGECTVQSSVNGNPADARVTSIIVNGRPVAEEALRWQYGRWSLRRYISDWADEKNLKTFEVQDGKVILETKGSD
ncbi:MAG: hypothetical protein JWO45_1199 [Spartobacteria bacterium]|nr:hypothetical protein [Spartobacteria bacterium]